MYINRQRPHLDANYDALILDDFWKKNPAVRFLVQRFVEKDDATHTLRDGSIYRKEEVTEATAVLFGVLHINLLKTFCHCPLNVKERS